MFISDPATKKGKDRRQTCAVNKLQSRTSCWAHCALLLSMFWAAQRWSRTSTLGRAGLRACWPCWPATCRARALGTAAGRVMHASAAARRACWLPLAAHAGRRCKQRRSHPSCRVGHMPHLAAGNSPAAPASRRVHQPPGTMPSVDAPRSSSQQGQIFQPSHHILVDMLRAQCRQTRDDDAELLLQEVQAAQLKFARDAAPTSSFQHLRAPRAAGPQGMPRPAGGPLPVCPT